MPIIDINKFKNQIVFFGFCPGADFSRRLDTRWKELGICEFQYFESKIQVKRFASIEIGDLIVLKKRQIIGKTMRVYGYGLVTGITKDDKGNRVLKVDWSSQEQVIEVPLLGCNATIDIRDIDKVRADMPDAFFEWLKKGSDVAVPLKAATKEDDNTSKLRFNHSKDKDPVVDKTVDKSLAGVKKTTDYSKIFNTEEWQTLKLGFAWSMLGIANVNGNGAEKKDDPARYFWLLLNGSFDKEGWFKEFDTGLVKQLISEFTNDVDWNKLVNDYLSGPYRSEEGMKEVGLILHKYTKNNLIERKAIDGYVVAIGHGMQSMVGNGLMPSNDEFSFYTDMICQMKDGHDGHANESSSLTTVMNGLDKTKKVFNSNQNDGIKQMLCNHLVYIGYHHIQSGNFDEALQYYQEALPVSKELAEKSERVEIKNDYRSLLDAIAGIYEKLGNVKDAMSYYQLGLDMAMELADKYYLRMTYVKLIKSLARFALFEKSQGNFNGALEKFTQCIPLISEASANFNDDVDERFSDLESFVLSQIDDINKKTNLSADKVSKNEPDKTQKSANKLTPFGLNPDVETVDINAIPRTDYSDEASTKSRNANKYEAEVQESESIDEDSTESELLDAAKRGNVDAMEWLAIHYRDGKWGNEDPVKEFQWWMKAAEYGSESGMWEVGISLGEEKLNNDIELALHYLRKLAAESEDYSAEAFNELGDIYKTGDHVDKDLDRAVVYYFKASRIDGMSGISGLIDIKKIYQSLADGYEAFGDANIQLRVEPTRKKAWAVSLLFWAHPTDLFKKLDENNLYAQILNADIQLEIAKEYFNKKIETDLNAMRDSVWHCHFWMGVSAENGCTEAKKYFKSLIQSGGISNDSIFNHYNPGVIHEHGLWGFEKNIDAAKKHYEKSVKDGSKEAVQALERLNSQNNSSKNRTKAEIKSKSTKSSVDFRVYENTQNTTSKKTNNYVSQPDDPNLLINNMNQFLNQKDYQSCENYLKEQANKGSAVAMYELGLTYTHGTFSNKDYKIALKYYQEAADLNYSKAMHNLAIAYSYGRGVDVDYDIAFKWFKKSAANLNIDSINALGVCYENGQGVDVDLEKAAGYFETAMNNGHVLAARNIANYYFRGKHFEVDRNKAADIWESLALAGDILSAKDIGICYENGHGRDKDLKQARAWYKIAADGGNEDAIKYLKELN